MRCLAGDGGSTFGRNAFIALAPVTVGFLPASAGGEVEEAAGAVGDGEVHEFLGIRIPKACSPTARARVATLLAAPYTQTQMSYDLRQRRLNGMIRRLERSNTYTLTPDGLRVAVFYVKVHDRLLRSLIAANSPPAPLTLRQALRTLDRHVEDYIAEARMAA